MPSSSSRPFLSRLPRSGPLALALGVALATGTLASAPVFAKKARADAVVDIPYETFTLPNGLRVVVHTDRKAPIVAVNIWYHVGSKDEPRGRTGFAHLFEHLMFNGSENHPGEFFEPFELVGATDMNGTTNQDRTNYFQNVPTTALDMALWMESDRMGHLLGAIDQAVLDEQRGVVQNEKRQREDPPYAQAWSLLGQAMYPDQHPYRHSVIGSMADLNAATLEDVKNWFRTWYGPNNAVLVLAGDIDAATAREKAMQYFGDIPAGPSMAQPKVDVAPLAADTRRQVEDKVPQARVYRVWNVPQAGDPDFERLQLFTQVLGGSRASRLDRRLLHADKSVDSVSASAFSSQLSSTVMITATVKQGTDPAQVEAAIDEELKKLLADGPTQVELDQARAVMNAGFVRGVERIGGFGGKADVLAECAVYSGDPGCFRESLRTLQAATVASVRDTARAWLGEGRGSHTLTIVPGQRTPLPEDPAVEPASLALPPIDPKYTTTASTVDRSQGVPVTTEFPDLKFPAVQRATLKNGTTVVLAERPGVPVVQFSYLFDGGFTVDKREKLGASGFSMAMLDEGAGKYDALAFGNRAELLGANLSAGASLNGGTAGLSALKANLEPSVSLFADMLRRPTFDQKEIDRVKATWIAGIAQEKARPNGAAMRVLPPLLYGQGHPYAIPLSGTGTEASIAALTRDDLVEYHRTWVRPENATLAVVGDISMRDLLKLLNKHFGDWKGVGEPSSTGEIPTVALPKKPRVYLIDQPGVAQTNIFVGQLVPSTRDPGSVKFDIANSVLGGEFSSRLNMNLREDKHWAYGSYSMASSALGQRPWMAFAPVQADKTTESLLELKREIVDYATGKAPPRPEEVSKIQSTEIRSLPGSFETAGAVLGTLVGNIRFGRDDNYVFQRKTEIEGLTVDQVREAAATIDPNALTWVLVGDLKQIEGKVRALELGEVIVIDADGKPVAR